MSLSEFIKQKTNIPSIKYADDKFNELKEQFIEMGQLKSDFDIEKFTVMKQGNFIAHQFHFLMRQYSLALYEMRRMLLDKDVLLRKIEKFSKLKDQEITIEEGKIDYADIYTKKLSNELDLLEVSVTNKIAMCIRFEEMRLELIKKNGGKAPTNEDHQKEEPQYWKWFIEQKAKEQLKASTTGISEGTWETVRMLEEPAVLNKEYQVKMLSETGSLLSGNLLE